MPRVDRTELLRYYEHLAPEYESVMNRLVPYYQKQNSLLMDLIPFQRKDEFSVLDLGSGPGVLSRLLLDTFPNAHVSVFDISPVMLDVCKKKHWAYPNRAHYIQGDFTKDDFGSRYDVVFAGLVLHHANDSGKKAFFQKLLPRMKPGGIVLARDIVRGSSTRLTQEYERLWRLYMRAQGEDSAAWYEKFQTHDPPATVENQLQWISSAGFEDVGCHWRYLNFAITGGRKPKA